MRNVLRSFVLFLALAVTSSAFGSNFYQIGGRPAHAQLIGALGQAASQKLNSGARVEAKLICLIGGSVYFQMLRYPDLARQNAAVLQTLNQACDPVYRGHNVQPKTIEATVNTYASKINTYGEALGFAPFGVRTQSTMRFYKRVVKARKVAAAAYKLALRYAEALPSLRAIFTDSTIARNARIVARNSPFMTSWKRLLQIATGQKKVKQLLKTVVVPQVLAKLKAIETEGASALASRDAKARHTLRAMADKAPQWIALLVDAQPNHPAIARYRKLVARYQAGVKGHLNARVAKNRMPKDLYRGKDRKRLERLLRAWHLRRSPTDKVLRIVITTHSWSDPVRRVRWNRGVATVSVKKYLEKITMAVKKTYKGKTYYRVVRASISREYIAGQWTKPRPTGAGMGYNILKENIFK